MHTYAAVTQFLLNEYLPDEGLDDLDPDYDLIATGVIDSLGLLELTSWLHEAFQIPDELLAVGPGDVRSVRAICDFIAATSPVATASGAAR
jgi:acyl carrier protein